ncbi:MAG: surE [Gammaproteobacteria bacterium]|jgi:5'-nucleotidase|nr:surE [Gammaproteobacteria bacterium]
MKILISNDDGVHAEGLIALVGALNKLGKVHVVAPDRDHSGVSNALTLNRPVRVRTLENGFVSVEGTPTDCVHLAITGLLNEQPHIVVSGINRGSNLGDDVLYSGTVAAAIEGRYLGLSTMAISLAAEGHTPVHYHYETAAAVAKQLVERLLIKAFPVNTILNVNVPNVPLDQLEGFEVTRLGARHKSEKAIAQLDPRGHTIYWIGPVGAEQDAGIGTDFYAINKRKVSITPLQIDLTHYQVCDQLSEWADGLELCTGNL